MKQVYKQKCSIILTNVTIPPVFICSHSSATLALCRIISQLCIFPKSHIYKTAHSHQKYYMMWPIKEACCLVFLCFFLVILTYVIWYICRYLSGSFQWLWGNYMITEDKKNNQCDISVITEGTVTYNATSDDKIVKLMFFFQWIGQKLM